LASAKKSDIGIRFARRFAAA